MRSPLYLASDCPSATLLSKPRVPLHKVHSGLPTDVRPSAERGASGGIRCDSNSCSVEPHRRALRADLLAMDSAVAKSVSCGELSPGSARGRLPQPFHPRHWIEGAHQQVRRILNQYVRQVLRCEIELKEGAIQLRPWVDEPARQRLENNYFGLRLLATTREEWTTAQLSKPTAVRVESSAPSATSRTLGYAPSGRSSTGPTRS